MVTNAFAAGAYAATNGLGALKTAIGKPMPDSGSLTQGTAGLSSAKLLGGQGGADFGTLVQSAIEGVSQAGQKADSQAVAAAAGKADIVDVVTAVAESEAALETLVAVRDRVIAAYEEIMRMPI